MARDRSEPSRTRYSQPSGNFAGTSQLVDVLDDGSLVLANVEGIDFGTNLSVTDNGDGTVTVAASGSGGGGFVAHPRFDIENQTFTDLGMGDDFSDGSLDAKWTAVSGTNSAVDLFSLGSTAKYEETGTALRMQPGTTNDFVELRQDSVPANGEEIIIAIDTADPDGDFNNESQIGFTINDDDTDRRGGTESVQFYYDGADNNIRGFSNTGFAFSDEFVRGQMGGQGNNVYLRLSRFSDTFYAFASTTGASWTPLAETGDATAFNNFWIFMRNFGSQTYGGIAFFRWVRRAATNGEHDPFQA